MLINQVEDTFMNTGTGHTDWLSTDAESFWGEIASVDHVLQIYENEGIFLDTLTGFVDSAIAANENAVVIATNAHLSALEFRLQSYGHNIEALILENKFIPVNADELLTEFVVDEMPDQALFMKTLDKLIGHATHNQRKFRAFGEMVAILWAKGNKNATLQLEELWNDLRGKTPFCLFCAYPKNIIDESSGTTNDSTAIICRAHSKLISGSEKQLTNILYREPDDIHLN